MNSEMPPRKSDEVGGFYVDCLTPLLREVEQPIDPTSDIPKDGSDKVNPMVDRETGNIIIDAYPRVGLSWPSQDANIRFVPEFLHKLVDGVLNLFRR